MDGGPIVIIGAARSGTNILRDVLTLAPGLVTWPCDEINYIWRHGNRDHPDDALPAAVARAEVARYIRQAFERIRRDQDGARVVEKTCANSLRVAFVDRVLPECRFVWIQRRGVDVVASAMKRWHARLDASYVARKARYVPPSDLPYYGLRYVRHRLDKLASGQRRLPTWGPRIPGMDALVAREPLHVVCALQWRECVLRAHDDFARIEPRRVVRVRYEDLVGDPSSELARILATLGQTPDGGAVQAGAARVHGASLGRGERDLTEQQLTDLQPILAGV